MRERRGYRPASPPKERILEPGSVDRTTTFVAGVRSESVTVHHLDVEGLPSSATARTLSSADNGAASQRVAVPQGWGARFGAFSTTAEIFVLEGDLAVGDQRLRRYGYVRCPAGVGITRIEAGEEGCEFLLCSNDALAVAGEASVQGSPTVSVSPALPYSAEPYQTTLLAMHRPRVDPSPDRGPQKAGRMPLSARASCSCLQVQPVCAVTVMASVSISTI